MSTLISNIDAKTRLAGANKLEALTFSLGVDARTGREEAFGINVFKVKEVISVPEITAAPGMPASVRGMVSLRGELVPVVDLAEFCGIGSTVPKSVLILTEFNGKTQGFLVASVDTILRISWSDMRVPPAMLAGHLRGLVTAITEQANKKLVMMLDVERVLSELAPGEEEFGYAQLAPLASPSSRLVYFADDSVVARKQIQRTLEALSVNFRYAMNGREAWEGLDALATGWVAGGGLVRDHLALVITDIEMPEMDGFALTKKIKSDKRFDGVAVLMHSSLSGNQNQTLGKSVGVDEFLSKFEPQRLAKAVREHLGDGP